VRARVCMCGASLDFVDVKAKTEKWFKSLCIFEETEPSDLLDSFYRSGYRPFPSLQRLSLIPILTHVK